ncbi:methyltransferase domain-containing protein [Kribbella qitaiheensis]|uniref:methyltransferase domain-containing protein n=1 Tax=Kribbella qitaiheensis TaxID=1544730 RepID=UPI00162AD31A|nr:methyltransferase domain-containing protein [Kribbella qitaiheensis]
MWVPVSQDEVGLLSWLNQVYADRTLPIRIGRVFADGSGQVSGHATAVASAPGLVVRLLEGLEVVDGMRVLEIGTGSGYSAALLAHRLGGDQVTSVDSSSEVTTRAGQAMRQAGLDPQLVVADGLDGYPAGALYDRVISHCSVRFIPTAWVEQTIPGGLIVAGLRGSLTRDAPIATLQVKDPATAQGVFSGGSEQLLAARTTGSSLASDGAELTVPPAPGAQRTTAIGPQILDSGTSGVTAQFVAQLSLPTVRRVTAGVDRDEVCLVDPLRPR